MNIKIKLKYSPDPFDVSVERTQYRDGNDALCAYDSETGEPFATFTSNLEGVLLSEGFAAFKTYSENEGMIEQLVEQGVVELTGRTVNNGFASFPIGKILIPLTEPSDES